MERLGKSERGETLKTLKDVAKIERSEFVARVAFPRRGWRKIKTFKRQAVDENEGAALFIEADRNFRSSTWPRCVITGIKYVFPRLRSSRSFFTRLNPPPSGVHS